MRHLLWVAEKVCLIAWMTLGISLPIVPLAPLVMEWSRVVDGLALVGGLATIALTTNYLTAKGNGWRLDWAFEKDGQ